mgnify:CR=1 FL=1
MNYKPEIAIIESNTLTCLGLKSILEEIIPMISELQGTYEKADKLSRGSSVSGQA